MTLQYKLFTLLKGIHHHWRSAVCPLAVGLVMAIMISWFYGKHSWESSGTMLYTPLPFSEGQKGLYTPPDLPTLVALVKSPNVLTELCKEYNLTIPTSTLDKLFKVTAARNTQTINVSLSWAEPEKCAALTRRLMELFIAQTRDCRRRIAELQNDDLAQRINEIDTKHGKAKLLYAQFFTEHNLLDAKIETEVIAKEIESLTAARTKAQREQISFTAQREKISKELLQLRTDAEGQRKFDAAMESLSDNRKRQDRLRELIDDERSRQVLLTELNAKRKDYERRNALYEQQAISKSDWEQSAKEIEVLTAKLQDNQKIQSWRDELVKIDEMVIPKGESKTLARRSYNKHYSDNLRSICD